MEGGDDDLEKCEIPPVDEVFEDVLAYHNDCLPYDVYEISNPHDIAEFKLELA